MNFTAGWLVGCFGFYGPLRQYFSLYRAVSQIEVKRGEKRIDESTNVQTTPTRTYYKCSKPLPYWGWSGGAMVLGNLPVPGRPTNLITVGQGPIALAVGAAGGGLDIFTLIYPFFSFSLSLGDGPI